MQEEARKVRAHSDLTGRPYFSINYKLSLSGRDLLSLALNECNLETIDSDFGGEATPPSPAFSFNSIGQRRNSAMDSSQRTKIVDLMQSSKTPGTPTSQFRKTFNSPTTTTTTNKDINKVEESSPPPSMRRVKSASTMAELELNRSAPMLVKFSTSANSSSEKTAFQQQQQQQQHMLPGFVTCLNSRNVAKYSVVSGYSYHVFTHNCVSGLGSALQRRSCGWD